MPLIINYAVVSTGCCLCSLLGRVGPGTIFGFPQAARSPWLVALRTPHGAISCLWEVLSRPDGALASPPAGNFCCGGTPGPPSGRPCPLIFVFRRGSIPRRSWRAGAPWFLVSAWAWACTFAQFPGCVQAGIALPSGARPGTSNTKTYLTRGECLAEGPLHLWLGFFGPVWVILGLSTQSTCAFDATP